MGTVNMVLIGAGSRGMDTYGQFALRNPHKVKFVAVAEPDDQRRELFCKKHGIGKEMQFTSWEELMSKPRLCEAALIGTQDQMHYKPTVAALEKGYDVLLEKPMSNSLEECRGMAAKAEEKGRFLIVCHVLRYTPFFSIIKEIVDKGSIGEIISVQHNENVGFWHQAHSFVRGNWRNSNESSAMILAKCCHDMDILSWLIGRKCMKISSFGSLTLFKRENAPEGSTDRCTDGCEAEGDCPFSAPKFYLGNTGWPTNVVSSDTDYEHVLKALKEGPYGRCVYKCDNNVVDHQVVNMEFEGGATVAFTMCAFTKDCSRTIKIMGTLGEIRGCMEKGEIELIRFNSSISETFQINTGEGHSGGDDGLMNAFIDQLKSGQSNRATTSAKASLQSHIMAFAAERSRVEQRTIDMEEFLDGGK